MSLVVSGLNQYWNNQCSSVRTGLSVRTLGARACASWSRKLVPRHCSGDQPTTNTQSNLETSLCSYITGHFRINTFSFKKKVQSNHGLALPCPWRATQGDMPAKTTLTRETRNSWRFHGRPSNPCASTFWSPELFLRESESEEACFRTTNFWDNHWKK